MTHPLLLGRKTLDDQLSETHVIHLVVDSDDGVRRVERSGELVAGGEGLLCVDGHHLLAQLLDAVDLSEGHHPILPQQVAEEAVLLEAVRPAVKHRLGPHTPHVRRPHSDGQRLDQPSVSGDAQRAHPQTPLPAILQHAQQLHQVGHPRHGLTIARLVAGVEGQHATYLLVGDAPVDALDEVVVGELLCGHAGGQAEGRQVRCSREVRHRTARLIKHLEEEGGGE
mmetsp:Transcript_27277/g.68037  ORF Transcript_27277/g.68037 Transcript_27277/m.68037 type:complete len:225 (+) Transcript_27277:1184-1858(+)